MNLDKTEKQVQETTAELKSTLYRLDEHNRYIEVVLGNITTGVVSADPLGNITTINNHAEHLLKVKSENCLGKPFRELFKSVEIGVIDEMLEAVKARKISSLTREINIKHSGERVLFQMTVSLLKDEAGEDLGTVLVFDDLSMLVNAQRAAAWREVARRIAHEIKNPLTPIRLSAQRLEKKFGPDIKDPAFSVCTETIIKQVDELKNLVNEFSNFARLPQAKPTLGSLNETISEALVLYQTGHKDIHFEYRPDPLLPTFEFDPEQIKRVVGNLLQNCVSAVESVPNPSVAITTHYDNVLRIAQIILADNGVGVPERDRSRVFEPYFSTKKNGTGLGLAIVKRIVEDHNGFVRIHANSPQGTKMIIELPVVQAQVLEA